MAEMMTDHELGFALYWLDISYDNFAVNARGKVMYIDVENVIVVDKAKIKRGNSSLLIDFHYRSL